MGNTRNWISFLGCCVIGLCGCQGILTGSEQSNVDSFLSSPVETPRTRPLDPPYTLAILPLDNLSSNPKLHWLGRSLSEMLTNDLAAWPSLSIVAREALGPVLREQWLQQREFSTPVAPVSLGHIQGVRYLVRGGFYQHKDLLTINLQIVDVETGAVVGALKVYGPEGDIPRLEHDLVRQMLAVFDSSVDSTTNGISGQLEEDTPKPDGQNLKEKKDRHHSTPTGLFGKHSVHQLDVQLSLERVTQQRIQAYQAAEAFWRDGWSIEIGQPTYHVWQFSENSHVRTPLLGLPFSLFMQPNAMADVLKPVGGGDPISLVHLESNGLVKESTDHTGVGQLFLEQVRQPQRIYVRALNEQGELMAVFSKWSWQSGGILYNPSPDEIFFPLWPQPFISGVAEFPVAWVERGGQHVTFDVVILPIPDEEVTLVLEPILADGAGEPDDHSTSLEEVDVLGPLQNWIRMKWNPPISEALPVDGYLPTNTQTVNALLHVHAGKIARVQFLNASPNPLFSRSLEELRSDLLGYCLSCQNAEKGSSSPTPHTIRLQLTLVKDLHGLRFGSRTP